MKRTLIRLGLSVLVTSALFGCGGGGSDGINGPTVTVPVNVSNAQNVGSNTTTATSASVALWRSLEPKVTVTGVSIVDKPVVRFAVTDAAGNAVVGLGNKSQSSTARLAGLVNLRFTLAKLVPATASAPSKWVSYLVLKPTTAAQAAGTGTFGTGDSCDELGKLWCGTFPTTDQEGTLVDNGDGTYVYTFARDITQAATIVTSLKESTDGLKKKADLGDVSYNAALTHRLGIQISGAAPGTGNNVPNATTVIPSVNIAIPANATYDFVPNGGAVTSTRSVVDKASCDSCHNGKGLAHGQGRNDPNYCATCHTDQVKYGLSGEATLTVASGVVSIAGTDGTQTVLQGRAIGDMPNFFHKIHMGSELKLKGYNYLGNVAFNENEWIQDPRDCTKCHSGDAKTDINQATQTKDGNNWKTKPSRLACGACHDNVSFTSTAAVGTVGTDGLLAHSGGTATDDSTCASCHAAGATSVGGAAVAPVDVAHRGETPTANNPLVMAGISTITYEIKSVTLNTTKNPLFVFRITKDGSAVTSFAAGANPIPGFTGGPTFYVAYSVPQDGIAAPADFNTYQSASLATLITGANGSLSAADASGYITATLTESTGKYKVPASAMMVTGAMIGNFNQVTFSDPLMSAKWNTSVGVDASATPRAYYLNGSTSPGLIVKTPLVQKLVAGKDAAGNNYVARRVIVDNNKCESCHEQLGTAVDFHGGARNDGTSCAICHNGNRSSSGWSANASTFIHGIHAGTSKVSADFINKTPAVLAKVGDPGKGGGGAGAAYNTGKRVVPFSWHRANVSGVVPAWNAAPVVYPGVLKNCSNCHVPNAVNYGPNASTIFPNLMWSTSTTGTILSSGDSTFSYPRDPVSGELAYFIDGVYGSGFNYSPAGSTTTTPAAVTTLVESPITSACFACHDSSTAKVHMKQYGGVIYGTRTLSGGATLVNNETCLICHGMGRDADAAVVHNKK
jgi:OmcA/MtrC family decaheme c-type cytochrome